MTIADVRKILADTHIPDEVKKALYYIRTHRMPSGHAICIKPNRLEYRINNRILPNQLGDHTIEEFDGINEDTEVEIYRYSSTKNFADLADP